MISATIMLEEFFITKYHVFLHFFHQILVYHCPNSDIRIPENVPFRLSQIVTLEMCTKPSRMLPYDRGNVLNVHRSAVDGGFSATHLLVSLALAEHSQNVMVSISGVYYTHTQTNAKPAEKCSFAWQKIA